MSGTVHLQHPRVDVPDEYPTGEVARLNGSVNGTFPLRITLLGGFEITRGWNTIGATSWSRRKAGQIIKILACHPERRVHREEVYLYLWPELDSHAAANNLRVTLHSARSVMRSHLRADGLIALRDGMVELAGQDRVTVDVHEFEAAAQNALASGNRHLYQHALALYSGELLPEDRFEEWAIPLRSRVHSICAQLIDELAALYERNGELDSARTLLHDLISMDPLFEEAHASLMRIEASAGNRVSAIRQFETLRHLLREQLQVEPDTGIQALHEQILAGTSYPVSGAGVACNEPALSLPGDFELRQAELHNLPASASRFVGRERETCDLRHAISMFRLVTVTGPGGSGKTRICLNVAEQIVDEFPDGVWLVELESITNQDVAIRIVAAELGIREDPLDTLSDRLVQHLQDRSMLLFFDNCEHLVQSVAGLVGNLLRRCPGVRVITTSREPLGVAGERVWRLGSMSVPDAASDLDPDSLSRNEAVELFIETAQERNYGFSPSDDEIRVIARICRELEGIPLSINLSAGWTTMLTVEQIACRLDSALMFLRAGSRTAPPRHRTLRATVNWSYNLLGDQERFVMRRTGVFRDSFTLEALGFVCGSDDSTGAALEDVVSSLIDKSLILVDLYGDTARYRTIGAVQEYAVDRLKELGELDDTWDRYRSWYINLADQAESGLVSREPSVWMEQLRLEIHNIRAVLRGSLEQGKLAAVLQIAGSLWGFWHLSGRVGEGRDWIEPWLRLPAIERVPELVRVRALHAAGFLAQRQGDYKQAIDWTEMCLEQARAIGDHRGINYALNNLCLCSLYRGELDRAIDLALESLELSHTTGIEPVTPSSLSTIGLAEFWRGNLDEAREYLQAAINAARGIGFTSFESWLLGQLADVALARGSSEEARSYASQAIDLGRTVSDEYGPALGCKVQARLAAEAGEYENAVHLLSFSLRIFQRLGYKLRMIECLEDLAEIAVSGADPTRAVRLLAVAEQLRSREGCPPPVIRRHTIDKTLKWAQSSMNAASFAAALTIGRTLTLEETVRDELMLGID
jgi:predicted ATPase/DNA-binding SARP family transcriptional activator